MLFLLTIFATYITLYVYYNLNILYIIVIQILLFKLSFIYFKPA